MAVWFCIVLGTISVAAEEQYFQANRRLAKAIVESLQDPKFDDELLFDLKKENQVYINRTMSLLIKYIVKREVDNYRSRRTDAISRRVYSSLVMKLIDIAKVGSTYRLHIITLSPTGEELCGVNEVRAKEVAGNLRAGQHYSMDLPRNSSTTSRIDTAHRYYMSVESRDMHDQMADVQVFHACARLYDILFTAPRILAELGNFDDLTPKILLKKLKQIDIKPVHLGITLLIQYHLRSTVNFALKTKAIEVLSTKPQQVGPQVIDMLKALASRLLPVSQLLDIHLAHYSPAFKDTCPSTWLGIVNNKQP